LLLTLYDTHVDDVDVHTAQDVRALEFSSGAEPDQKLLGEHGALADVVESLAKAGCEV
jgi:hypothetical protein